MKWLGLSEADAAKYPLVMSSILGCKEGVKDKMEELDIPIVDDDIQVSGSIGGEIIVSYETSYYGTWALGIGAEIWRQST